MNTFNKINIKGFQTAQQMYLGGMMNKAIITIVFLALASCNFGGTHSGNPSGLSTPQNGSSNGTRGNINNGEDMKDTEDVVIPEQSLINLHETICTTISFCHSTIDDQKLNDCHLAIAQVEGAPEKIGFEPSEYSNFIALYQDIVDGHITENSLELETLQNCEDEIQLLPCDEEVVENSYQPDSDTPFSQGVFILDEIPICQSLKK